MNSLLVTLVQHACTPDREENFATAAQAVREAARLGARLVVLPELHTHRYFCQREDPTVFDTAEPIPGPTTERLAALARDAEVVLVGTVFERRAAGVSHNTAVVCDSDGSLAGRYRKMHIPDDPGYHEKFYFTPGDLGFEPIRTSLGTLGVLVCWDQWFPEAARLMALADARLLIYPSAIGWDPRDADAEKTRQLEAWITVHRGHAIANCIPVLSCNRCGHEADPSEATAGIDFWGNSFACGPQGELLGQAGTAPENVMVELDLARSKQVRRIWPYFRDRRIDAYRALLSRVRD